MTVIGFGSRYEKLFPTSRAYDDASLEIERAAPRGRAGLSRPVLVVVSALGGVAAALLIGS